MKKIVSWFFVLGFTLVPATVMASESPNAGSDSCGLGWEVTQQKTLFGTATRATTDAFLPPTFSMTSGTSGCASHPIAKKDEDAVKYLATNFDPVSEEMARGNGEYLDGLAKVMGCTDSSVPVFEAATHRDFKALVNDGSVFDTFQNLKNELKSNPALASGCGAV